MTSEPKINLPHEGQLTEWRHIGVSNQREKLEREVRQRHKLLDDTYTDYMSCIASSIQSALRLNPDADHVDLHLEHSESVRQLPPDDIDVLRGRLLRTISEQPGYCAVLTADKKNGSNWQGRLIMGLRVYFGVEPVRSVRLLEAACRDVDVGLYMRTGLQPVAPQEESNAGSGN